MEENKIYFSHCGVRIKDEGFNTVSREPVFQDYADRYTVVCNCCNELIWGIRFLRRYYTSLCSHCCENYYTRCKECDALIHRDDVFRFWYCDYCSEYYNDVSNGPYLSTANIDLIILSTFATNLTSSLKTFLLQKLTYVTGII